MPLSPRKATAMSSASNAAANGQLDELVHQLEPILRHINAHRFLWGFTLVCALVAWNRGLLLLYGMVAFLLAVLVISYGFYWFNLKGVEVEADFVADEAIADSPATLQIALYSQWRKHFLRIEIPIERLNHSLPNTPSYQADVFVLSHKGLEAYQSHTPLPRGVYQCQTALLSCGYPFGLLTARRELTIRSQKLYVLPRWFWVTKLAIASVSERQDYQSSSTIVGGHDDFHDIRAYRRGDALKTVHWGASARQVSRGKDWMVKTFTNQDMPVAIIVLNPFDVTMASVYAQTLLDTMISTALSIGQYISRQGYQVQVVGFERHASQHLFVSEPHQPHSGVAHDSPLSPKASDSVTSDTIVLWQLPLTPQMFAQPASDDPVQTQGLYSLHQTDALRKLAEVEMLSQAQMSYQQGLAQALHRLPQANVLVSFTINAASQHSGNIGGNRQSMTHVQVNFCPTTSINTSQSASLSDHASSNHVRPNPAQPNHGSPNAQGNTVKLDIGFDTPLSALANYFI